MRLFICRTRHKLKPHTVVGGGRVLGEAGAASPEPGKTARPTDELALFFQPTKFAASLSRWYLLSLPHLAGSLEDMAGSLLAALTNLILIPSSQLLVLVPIPLWLGGGTKNRFVCFR